MVLMISQMTCACSPECWHRQSHDHLQITRTIYMALSQAVKPPSLPDTPTCTTTTQLIRPLSWDTGWPKLNLHGFPVLWNTVHILGTKLLLIIGSHYIMAIIIGTRKRRQLRDPEVKFGIYRSEITSCWDPMGLKYPRLRNPALERLSACT